MTVYFAWSEHPFSDDPAELLGPWESLHRVATTALLVDSSASLSRVYHELKWTLPDSTPLFVVEVAASKSAHVAPGTLTWLRHRSG